MNRVLIAGIVNNLSAALAACIAEPDATQIPTWGEAGKDWREFVMQEVDKKLANPDATPADFERFGPLQPAPANFLWTDSERAAEALRNRGEQVRGGQRRIRRPAQSPAQLWDHEVVHDAAHDGRNAVALAHAERHAIENMLGGKL